MSYDPLLPSGRRVRPAKIVVLGPFGVGKTTLIGAVSEIEPLATEELMTAAAADVDTALTAGKDTTTVALDFGRLTVAPDVVLQLFGAPGQQRFAPVVDDLLRGALGVLVLVDPARLAEAFWCLDLVAARTVPHAVAVNSRPGTPAYPAAEIRDALLVPPTVPIVDIDAREHRLAVLALLAVVSTALRENPT